MLLWLGDCSEAAGVLDSVAVRLSNLHMCRENIYTLLNAINDLDNVDVGGLSMPSEASEDAAPGEEGFSTDDDDDDGEDDSELSPLPRTTAGGAGGAAPDSDDSDADQLGDSAIPRAAKVASPPLPPVNTAQSRRTWKRKVKSPHGRGKGKVAIRSVVGRRSSMSGVVHALKVWRLSVNIEGARDLPRMDLDGLLPSDPYVSITLLDSVGMDPGNPEVCLLRWLCVNACGCWGG